MLEDPRVNFAISTRPGRAAGISHLGIQAEDEAELAEVYDRLARAERPIVEAKATTCCYAQSDKQWIADPQGRAMGNLPHLWRKHGLWRRFAGQAERGQRSSLLRADLLRTRSDPAGGA